MGCSCGLPKLDRAALLLRPAGPPARPPAAAGECDRNPGFMRGDHFVLGACRAACGTCERCAAGDLACKNRNRERDGYLPLFEDPAQL